MINFKAVFEYFFKSFVVARDIEMVDRLTAEGYDSFLLIKRSWLFGVLSSFWLVPIIGIAVANVYLILKHFEYSNFGIALSTALGFTIIATMYSSFRYLYDYHNSYSKQNRILRGVKLRENLTIGDASFIRCFNQLQFNFFFFIVIIAIYIGHIFVVSQFVTGIWAFLDIICSIVQMVLIRHFIRLLIDLEMDFNLVAGGKIFFVNQTGIYADINTLDAEKIKTIRSSIPHIIASLFHYGTIDILTEGDEIMGHMQIDYIDDPEETVENINSILTGKHEVFERVHNYYLEKILGPMNNLDPETRKAAIRTYLKNYESQIKADYVNTQDPETRAEIEEIYKEYYGK